jgi:two-component system cell cycle sensor histidine kinase PleC
MTQTTASGQLDDGTPAAPAARRGRKPRLDPSVREAREKLTHQTERPPEFDYEMLRLYAGNYLKAALLLPMVGIIVAIASLSWEPAELVGEWLAGLFLSSLALIVISRHMLQLPRKEVRVHVWRSRFMLAELANGLVWSFVATFGATTGDHRAHMFVFVALSLVNSLRMMLANAAIVNVYAGTLPIMLGLLGRFAFINDQFYWAMACLSVGVYVFSLYLMNHLNANTLTLLELRAEKDTLIADLEQATAYSEEGRRTAEAANVAKSRFLATMSHELRTPLNAINGFSEMMKDELLGPHAVPAYKSYAADIHRSGQHLLNLINEILDISRIEAGKYELKEEAVSLSSVAEGCCHMVKMRAEGKGLTIVQDYEPGLERLWADERAIRQVCLNLLSNAVKFTPNGGRIVVSTGRGADGGQFIKVRDNGPGIPQEELTKVLSPFGQGSLAHVNAEGGTGLGLPIVRGLIRLHGGAFDLKSKLREGTEVTASFPRNRVMQVMPQIWLDERTEAQPEHAAEAMPTEA